MTSRERARFPAIGGAAIGLIVVVIAIGVLQPRFLGPGNLLNILRDASILGLVACGQVIVIVSGGIDLSAGSAIALISVITTMVALNAGVPAAFATGLLVALGVGVVNGVLVARFALPPFLATLGMLTAAHGLASVIVGGTAIAAPGGAFSILGVGSLGPIPISVSVAALGFAALWVLLNRTTVGRSWYLVGSNAAAARVAGLPIRRSIFTAYLVGSLFVGLAGLILTSRVNSGQPNLSPTLAFEAIAACAIGGIPLTGGIGRVSQVLVGVLFLAAVNNGLLVLDLPSSMQIAATGVLMIVAVALQHPGMRSIWRTTWRANA